MTDHDCGCDEEFGCDEEYGPCENHMIQLAQRVGSSNRSADELCAVYLDDALGIDPDCLSPYGLNVKARVDAALAALGPFESWLDDVDLGEELRDVVWQVENHLDACTTWDDGYIIYRLNGGPLDDDTVPTVGTSTEGTSS